MSEKITPQEEERAAEQNSLNGAGEEEETAPAGINTAEGTKTALQAAADKDQADAHEVTESAEQIQSSFFALGVVLAGAPIEAAIRVRDQLYDAAAKAQSEGSEVEAAYLLASANLLRIIIRHEEEPALGLEPGEAGAGEPEATEEDDPDAELIPAG